MRFTLAVLFFLAAASLGSAQDLASRPARVGVGITQQRLSLQDAVQRALKSNLDIEVEKTNVANAQENVAAAIGLFDLNLRYLPLLEDRNTPAGSVLQGANGVLNEKFLNNNVYLKQRVPQTGGQFALEFTNSRQDTTNPFSSFTPFLTSQLTISYTQPLLRNRGTDPQRTEIRVRRKQAGVAETDYRLRVIDVITQVEQSYWNLVAARQDVTVTGDAVELARQQLSTNQRLIASGTLAPVEISASEAELERRLDAYYAALGTVTEAENSLKSLICASRDEALWQDEVVPTDEHSLDPPAIDDLPQLVTDAIRQRPELHRVALQQQIAQDQRLLADNQRRPQVDLAGGYSLTGLGGVLNNSTNPFTASSAALYDQVNALSAKAGLAPLPVSSSLGATPDFLLGGYGTTLANLFGGRYQSIQGGLQIDMNFRNRTANAQYAQTVIGEKRLKLEQARSEQLIEAQVRNALQAIRTARQRVTAAEAGAKAAREKLESETRLFQTGESTNFLVLTRQNEYADARRRSVVAALDLNKAISRLGQAVGTTLDNHGVKLVP